MSVVVVSIFISKEFRSQFLNLESILIFDPRQTFWWNGWKVRFSTPCSCQAARCLSQPLQPCWDQKKVRRQVYLFVSSSQFDFSSAHFDFSTSSGRKATSCKGQSKGKEQEKEVWWRRWRWRWRWTGGCRGGWTRRWQWWRWWWCRRRWGYGGGKGGGRQWWWGGR